jgi:hypothetical protein
MHLKFPALQLQLLFFKSKTKYFQLVAVNVIQNGFPLTNIEQHGYQFKVKATQTCALDAQLQLLALLYAERKHVPAVQDDATLVVNFCKYFKLIESNFCRCRPRLKPMIGWMLRDFRFYEHSLHFLLPRSSREKQRRQASF